MAPDSESALPLIRPTGIADSRLVRSLAPSHLAMSSTLRSLEPASCLLLMLEDGICVVCHHTASIASPSSSLEYGRPLMLVIYRGRSEGGACEAHPPIQ